MKLAIFSDIHDNPDGFAQTLKDAERCNADQYISLGDVGHNPHLFKALHERKIPCVYGNWEVNGWSRLPADLGQWVGSWPTALPLSTLMPTEEPRQAKDAGHQSILFTHATPAMPPPIKTTAEMTQLLNSGVSWTRVFPRLHNDDQAMWDAFGHMEEENIRAAFHGHTHVQMVWAWSMAREGEKRKLRSISGPTEFVLELGRPTEPNRYLIGVGSCGEPHDGEQLRYALLDTVSWLVELRAIG